MGTAALNILKGFYEKKAAALAQVQEPAGPPPPPGFEAYKKNAAAGGVMGMIQQIINDAKAMEAEVIRSEEDAQEANEDKEAVMMELEQLANYKAELHSSCDFVMKN